MGVYDNRGPWDTDIYAFQNKTMFPTHLILDLEL